MVWKNDTQSSSHSILLMHFCNSVYMQSTYPLDNQFKPSSNVKSLTGQHC